MLPILLFAVLGGALTILSPCTLPVVPLLLGGAADGGRGRILGLFVGFALVFIAVTVALASTLAALGLTTDRLRMISVVLLGLFGATLVIPSLSRRLEIASGPLARLGSRIAGPTARTGFLGGLLIGGAIGLVWAPCVGPIMAAVIAAAVTFGPSPATLVIAVAYVVGASIPLAMVARWGRRATFAMGGAQRRAGLVRVFGALMVATSLLVVTGADTAVQAAVTGLLPAGWSGAIASVEEVPAVQEGLDVLRRSATSAPLAGSIPSSVPGDAALLPAPVAESLPDTVALEDLGQAPDLTGITTWINSDPLTFASLRGKVVLVEFWTFGCINCIHVQPYVKAWYDRYATAGLVVIGVHTPELSFERDIDNVREAVAKANVRFPVAFDPAFATWNAYRNNYWPAFYFIDKTGRIRHTHAGEGDYDGSERVIRELLAEPG